MRLAAEKELLQAQHVAAGIDAPFALSGALPLPPELEGRA
jgi:hypothetical protein